MCKVAMTRLCFSKLETESSPKALIVTQSVDHTLIGDYGQALEGEVLSRLDSLFGFLFHISFHLFVQASLFRLCPTCQLQTVTLIISISLPMDHFTN